MASRMDKYSDETFEERTTRNKDLYNTIYGQRSRFEDLPIPDNTNEIDIESFKNITLSRNEYQKKAENKNANNLDIDVDKVLTKIKKSNVYGKYNNLSDDRKGTTEKYPTSILKVPRLNSSKMLYPTEKPIELLEYLIKTYTDEGEVVLDNCMGSGTTGVACKNTNRSFIGIEINKNAFEIAKKRLNFKENCV